MGKKQEKKVKKVKTAKDRILDILFVVFALIAVGSGAYLFRYYYTTDKTESKLKDLKQYMEEDTDEDGDAKTVTIQTEDKKEKVMLKKFEKLYEMNSDIVGWITIEDTDIDFPVMYSPDDGDFYLYADFDKNWSGLGTPFVEMNCKLWDDRSDNIIIYGHNIRSGKMFHELLNYDDEDYYKEHKYIQFDTLYELGTYEIIAAFKTQIYDSDDTEHFHYYEFFDAKDEAEFDEYIDYAKENTSYTIAETAEYGDELLTLSTCSHHVTNGRFVILAKKIDTD